jgi:glyoxylase-like metal-dependent hydrolase (beta-lactamase superfamily II)
MNHLEAELDYPLGDTMPELGSVQEVAPGLHWVRMTLPFALNHINLWLLDDLLDDGDGPRRGWTIVDCGIATDTTRSAWEQVFETALQGRPVLRVIATHYHPDHMGLAEWLCDKWKVKLWTTAGEYAVARMMSADMPGYSGASLMAHYVAHGLPGDAVSKVGERRGYYARLVPAVPETYRRLQDGQQFNINGQRWQVITGFGHSPEHASLWCEERGLLISGDMVLPRISTNVSVQSYEPESDPVTLYLNSLGKFAHLPQDTLVLPSHGKPFRGLHTRIRQLREHHAERLQEVIEACREKPMSACDIVPIMFRRELDAHQLSFALGEALAHLHALWFEGKLKRRRDPDQVFRFYPA